jgi:hypothetical protein
VGKVFSITDFKEGLDVRKSPLTAPGGSLRILDNAWLTPGGEIEKRPAFVPVTTLPSNTGWITGQRSELHVFGMGAPPPPTINQGICPHPLIGHALAPYPGTVAPYAILDVEPFDPSFYVNTTDAAGTRIAYYNDTPVFHNAGETGGTYSRTYKTKMYRMDDKYLRFSGVNNPAVIDPASTTNPGAGFINVAMNDPEGEVLIAMEVFYDRMAVMARLMTQLWHLDPDPTQDTLQQVIRIGTVAPHSVIQFGTGDILFLSDSGVRSLKSQTITNTAAVSDVGSAIDPLMTYQIRTNGNAVSLAKSIVQPIAGRYWLAIGDTVYVLSYFPAGNITAWSTFSPGFVVQEWAVVDNRIYCRGPDQTLYLFGGVDNQTYDSCPVTVRTPHMDIEGPTTRKRIQSVDVMCQGAWSVSMGMLPNNTEAFELVANVQDNTFGLQSIPFAGYGTHVGLELAHRAPGPALLAAIHLNTAEASVK